MTQRSLSPGTQPLDQALDHSVPLALLLQRVQAARERFQSIRTLLPAELQNAVRAGPLDDTNWSLLADSSAVAAKLRQLLPRLEEQLLAAGHAERVLKVKVLPRT
jgi:hypothetical protein